MYAYSPHLLEIVYCAVITAAISNPHSSHIIIRNVPIHRCFIVYVEIMCKGMGVTYHPACPHAMPPQVSGQSARGTNWELEASLHWKDMTQFPIIPGFMSLPRLSWLEKLLMQINTTQANFAFAEKNPPRVEFFRASVLSAVCACTVTSDNAWSWAGIFRNKLRSKTYDLFKSSCTTFPRS